LWILFQFSESSKRLIFQRFCQLFSWHIILKINKLYLTYFNPWVFRRLFLLHLLSRSAGWRWSVPLASQYPKTLFSKNFFVLSSVCPLFLSLTQYKGVGIRQNKVLQKIQKRSEARMIFLGNPQGMALFFGKIPQLPLCRRYRDLLREKV